MLHVDIVQEKQQLEMWAAHAKEKNFKYIHINTYAYFFPLLSLHWKGLQTVINPLAISILDPQIVLEISFPTKRNDRFQV